jgi:hypothetical protein
LESTRQRPHPAKKLPILSQNNRDVGASITNEDEGTEDSSEKLSGRREKRETVTITLPAKAIEKHRCLSLRGEDGSFPWLSSEEAPLPLLAARNTTDAPRQVDSPARREFTSGTQSM